MAAGATPSHRRPPIRRACPISTRRVGPRGRHGGRRNRVNGRWQLRRPRCGACGSMACIGWAHRPLSRTVAAATRGRRPSRCGGELCCPRFRSTGGSGSGGSGGSGLGLGRQSPQPPLLIAPCRRLPVAHLPTVRSRRWVERPRRRLGRPATAGNTTPTTAPALGRRHPRRRGGSNPPSGHSPPRHPRLWRGPLRGRRADDWQRCATAPTARRGRRRPCGWGQPRRVPPPPRRCKKHGRRCSGGDSGGHAQREAA